MEEAKPLKIIFLNALLGQVGAPFSAFIREQSASTDIFCFEESSEEMETILRGLLPEYQLLSGHKSAPNSEGYEQATYIRSGLTVKSSALLFQEEQGPGFVLYTEIQQGDTILHICNVHGNWLPIDKLDSPGRIRQSEGIITFLKNKTGAKIIGGDFNLFPETKSIVMFTEHGYRDLIKEFAIKTTRNTLAWKKYPDNPQYYADYAFISPDVNLIKFEVLSDEVSDHLPLVLEFEVA